MNFVKYPDMKTLFKLIPLGVNGKKWDATSGEILPETAPLHYFPIEDLIFTEKIDGSNMSIRIDNNALTHVQKRNEICSRENKGDSFYFELADRLIENILAVEFPSNSYFVYGELCGIKVQKGGNYFDNRRFLVFDILDIDNNKFFTWDALNHFADLMALEVVPQVQYTQVDLKVESVKEFIMNLKSAYNNEYGAEGFVVRHSKDSLPYRRWMAKIRRKDFKE
jgi:ATP-dependent RNA circularization protein (DNA/RNA ligase family)